MTALEAFHLGIQHWFREQSAARTLVPEQSR